MNYLYDLWDDLISILFPRICYACGNQLLRNEQLICTECFVSIPRTNYHLGVDTPLDQLFWGRCRLEKAAAFSFYSKGSRIRKLIHNLKYNGIKEIGEELGRIYGSALNSSGFTSGMDLIIPVPLHPVKERIRGYNQSLLIASGLSETTNLPVDTGSLVRSSASDTQTKRSRYERWANVSGIFTIADRDRIAGKHILLVDDVITTGSTIEACANELLKVEDVRVSVVALACAVV